MHEPSRLLPKFCMMPMLWPRRLAVEFIAIRVCEIGSIGPSATPISRRAASSMKKVLASPEKNEHTENTITATNR
ncbi:hypothetical protein D3C81_1072900 [compost metagenome]